MAIKKKKNKASGGKSPRNLKKDSNKTLTGELADVYNAIQKNHSRGVIRMGGDRSYDYGRLPLGILAVDLALAGGLKLSRGCMFYGEKSSGKSTLAIKACVAAQKKFPDKTPVLIDIEGTYDPVWANFLGLDNDNFVLVEPESGEEAVDIACALLQTHETSILITDSIAFITPMKEIEEDSEKHLMGVHARLIGSYLRKINNALLCERHRGHTPISLYINQFRMKIGAMFGDPRTLPGGKALEFATSQQMLILNKEIQKDGVVSHNEHSIRVTKDKTGGRIKEAKFNIVRNHEVFPYPVGYIDQAKTILTTGASVGLVEGRYKVDKLGQFRTVDEFGQYLFNNPEAEKRIQRRIIKRFQKSWGLI